MHITYVTVQKMHEVLEVAVSSQVAIKDWVNSEELIEFNWNVLWTKNDFLLHLFGIVWFPQRFEISSIP